MRRSPGTASARWIALACLALSACESPFQPWGDDRDYRPAAPHLYLNLGWGEAAAFPPAADTLAPTLRVSGQLMLDRMRDGRRRVVQRPELIVAGRPIAPRREPDGWHYLYEETRASTWEHMRDTVLVVQPPVLEGITASPAELRFPLWTREGGSDVLIRAGVDPVLHLRGPASQPTGPVSWSLQVSGTGSGSFAMNGTGVPPAALRVPAENLPVSASGRYTAALEIVQFTPSPTIEQRSAYMVAASLRTRMRWQLQVQTP